MNQRNPPEPEPEPLEGLVQIFGEDAVPIVDQTAIAVLLADRLP